MNRIVPVTIVGILASVSLAFAQMGPPPVAPGRLHHFEIKKGPGQVVMVPLGEGDRTGMHLRVRISNGQLQDLAYHAGCGPVLLHGPDAERVPGFAPTPTAYGENAGPSLVCGDAIAPGLIYIDRQAAPPRGTMSPADGTFVPLLPGGAVPMLVAQEQDLGCFSWLELIVDTSGLKVGTQIVATVEGFAPGARLDLPPARVNTYLAAVVTP